ncbi:MAG TPA: hypothetical protein VGM29_04390 [Polyangiaceae bacterium]|jgi:hypothetical protein
MKTKHMLLGFAAISGLSAFAWAQSRDTGLRPIEAFERLDRVDGELQRASERLSTIPARGGIELPPDPCRAFPPGPCRALPPDPCRAPSFACRDTRLLGNINGQSEGLLALVAAIDNGTDESALLRRLDREATTSAWNATRVEGLSADWVELPPDPCTPAATEAIEVLARSAEVIAAGASRVDQCAEPTSIERRLDHVGAALDIAALRLDEIGAGSPPEPDSDVNPPEPDRAAKLDTIIARAEAIAAFARSLKGGSQTGTFVPPRG